MSDATHDEKSVGDTPGMRVAFWSWVTIVAGGLAVMIVLPLLGR